MKVIFITASVEPGKDGVGDYSRRLAAALMAKGHLTALLALSDKFIDAKLQEIQTVDGYQIPVLRVPKHWGMQKQVAEAKEWVTSFNPNWLSLQYVPFGFNPKGLPFGLSKWLKQLSGRAKWHVMFHEVWVGMAKEESQKLIWWGRLQKALISSLVKNLNPEVVHTQTMLYLAHLKQMGIQAKLLPLFGNIPVTAGDISRLNATEIKFVVFGAIHSGGLIKPFAREAAAYSKQKGVMASLTFAGRCGDEQYEWATIWEDEGLPVEVLGEQSSQQLSILLSSATAGINTTGLAVVEKSGAFAAMRDHGLPVISLSKLWTPFDVPVTAVPEGVFKYNGDNFEACLSRCVRYAANPYAVAGVAGIFINDLLATAD